MNQGVMLRGQCKQPEGMHNPPRYSGPAADRRVAAFTLISRHALVATQC